MSVLVAKEAPDFTAPAVMPEGAIKEDFKLSDLRGKYVVLFFWPLDFTFVCPTEIRGFQDILEDFEDDGVAVIGASTDSFFSHKAWFADREGRQSRVREAKLHHYRYRWLDKPSGGRRLLEIPKVRLKTLQRQILHELLDRVPAHPAAHGFRRHRSCLSYVSPHVGQAALLRMDLQDFFHSVPVWRIGALFRRLGYPASVARLLQGLCTHSVSPTLAGQAFGCLDWQTRQRLRHKHLPQGAPSSPAIANLCAWRLDCRLQGLAGLGQGVAEFGRILAAGLGLVQGLTVLWQALHEEFPYPIRLRLAAGDLHQLAHPADPGDHRVVPFLEVDARPVRARRRAAGDRLQALDVARHDRSAHRVAHQQDVGRAVGGPFGDVAGGSVQVGRPSARPGPAAGEPAFPCS